MTAPGPVEPAGADQRLRIRGIRVRGLDLALARPVETAAGVMRTAPLVLIDLATEEGVTGRSYVRCYTPLALAPLTRLVANLAVLVTGDAAEPAAVEAKLQRHVRLLGPQGLVGMAIAGIDMAVWDACAKAAGMPLARYLGGTPTPVLRPRQQEDPTWTPQAVLSRTRRTRRMGILASPRMPRTAR
jgi:mandelate racemase